MDGILIYIFYFLKGQFTKEYNSHLLYKYKKIQITVLIRS